MKPKGANLQARYGAAVNHRFHLAYKLIAVHNTSKNYLDRLVREAGFQREGVAGKDVT